MVVFAVHHKGEEGEKWTFVRYDPTCYHEEVFPNGCDLPQCRKWKDALDNTNSDVIVI